MQTVDAYAHLNKELATAVALLPAELAHLADDKPFSRTVAVSGEPLEIDLVVSWHGNDRSAVSIARVSADADAARDSFRSTGRISGSEAVARLKDVVETLPPPH